MYIILDIYFKFYFCDAHNCYSVLQKTPIKLPKSVEKIKLAKKLLYIVVHTHTKGGRERERERARFISKCKF